MEPPFRWVGGKRWLAERLVAMLPPDRTRYVEVFFGGGAVFFAKPPEQYEVINDIDDVLVTFFRVVRGRLAELRARFRWELRSRAAFLQYRASDWTALDEVEKAFRFWYVIHHAYGGLFRRNQRGECNSPWNPSLGKDVPFSEAFWDLERLEAVHRRLRHAVIENRDYREVLAAYDGPGTVFYLDPPYGTEYQYGRRFDHGELAEVLRGLRGRWLLTLNAELAPLFAGYRMERVPAQWRIGTRSTGAPAAEEIIVSNYEPPAVVQQKLVL